MSDEQQNCDGEDGALAAVLSAAHRNMSDLQFRPLPIMVDRATRGPFDKNREDDGLVLGIGFDLIDLSDFTRTLKRSGERFIQRIYTKEEIEYCRAQPHPVQSFAVRFAAKEAAMKALGIAGQEGLSWRDFHRNMDAHSSGRQPAFRARAAGLLPAQIKCKRKPAERRARRLPRTGLLEIDVTDPAVAGTCA